MRRLALLGLALLSGCMGDARLDELLAEVRSLRQQSTAEEVAAKQTQELRAELRQAFAPMREALGELVAQQHADRERFAALSAEIGNALGEIRVLAEASERNKFDAMHAKLRLLQGELEKAAETNSRDQALILRALDLTADKLNDFLQRVQKVQTTPAVGAPDTPGGSGGSGGSGGQDQASVWPWAGGLGLAGLLAVGWCLRRSRTVTRRDRAGEVTAEPIAGLARQPPRPVEVVQDLVHSDWKAARETIREFLAMEPSVLLAPGVDVTEHSGGVRVRYHLTPGGAVAEAGRIEAAVAELAQDLEPVAARCGVREG